MRPGTGTSFRARTSTPPRRQTYQAAWDAPDGDATILAGLYQATVLNPEETMTTATLQARSLVPSLTVNDLERSTRFYIEGLGFALEDEYKTDGEVTGVMLAAGETKLGLSQDDFAKGRDRAKGVGIRLYLETDQDVKVLARQAQKTGIRLDSDPAPLPWGPIGFTLTDPDGFKLTISNAE